MDEENLGTGWVAPSLRRDRHPVRGSDYERLVSLLLREAGGGSHGQQRHSSRARHEAAQKCRHRLTLPVVCLSGMRVHGCAAYRGGGGEPGMRQSWRIANFGALQTPPFSWQRIAPRLLRFRPLPPICTRSPHRLKVSKRRANNGAHAMSGSFFVPHDLDAPLRGAATGPLAGFTAVVKDMYDIAGSRTGGGNPD